LYDVLTSPGGGGDEPFLVIIIVRHRNFTPENYKFNEGDGIRVKVNKKMRRLLRLSWQENVCWCIYNAV
jgi:hypothetical protein